MKDFLVKLIKNPYVLNLLLAVVVACALGVRNIEVARLVHPA